MSLPLVTAPMLPLAWAVALVPVLLAVTAVFVAVEAGLVAVRRSRIEELADADDRRATRALRALDELPVSVTAAQLLVSAAAIGLGALIEPVVGEPLRDLLARSPVPDPVVPAVALAVAVAGVAVLHTVLGVLVATHLATARPVAVTLALAGPVSLVVALLRPAILVLRV